MIEIFIWRFSSNSNVYVYQENQFCATSDVTVLVPNYYFNKYVGLFVATIINMEKNKWSYGRQIRLGDSQKLRIRLPVDESGAPAWRTMENIIKTMPFGDRI